MQPDLDTLRSLVSLYDQIDFKRFRAFLLALEVEETRRAIHAVDNPDVARGRAQMVVWLRDQIETCKQAASKMEIRVDHTTKRPQAGRGGGQASF